MGLRPAALRTGRPSARPSAGGFTAVFADGFENEQPRHAWTSSEWMGHDTTRSDGSFGARVPEQLGDRKILPDADRTLAEAVRLPRGSAFDWRSIQHGGIDVFAL